MRLIDNMLLIKADDKDNHEILLNTLSGKIHILTTFEADCIRKWKTNEPFVCENEDENNLVLELQENGYVMSITEEEELEKRIMSRCRERHSIILNENKFTVFVLTYMCNFACPYCYESAPKCTNSSIMTEEMVDRIFDINGGTLSQIALYGGEPFLPETRSIIEYIVSKASNADFSVTTNGYYLLEFSDLLRKLNVQNVMVTLDGPEDLHNKTRKLKNGEGTYSKIMQGIRTCLMHSIPIKIRMNITPENISPCEQLRESLIKEFPTQFNKKILTFELQPIFQLSTENKDELNERLIFNKMTDCGLPTKYNMISLTSSPVLRTFINNTRQNFRHRYCHCDAEDRRRFYDSEGDIYSCILSLNNKAATVGTYYPECKFKGSSFLTRNIESIPQCKTCKLKFLCGGGCANAILNTAGDVMKPNCQQILHEVYDELPKLFGKYTNSELI